MNFNEIYKELSDQEKDSYSRIFELKKIDLASMGSNDTEGYQVFTPEFIVKDMTKCIGSNEIFDITKTVLEPTSGDGAFTVYILNERLKRIWKNSPQNFEVNSLVALSTIYSIEMDSELIIKQRSNVFTLYHQFIKKNKIVVSNEYFEVVKCIISTNFIWAMFNSDNPIGEFSIFSPEVAYKMPEAEKKNFIPLDMPVWKIDVSSIQLAREGVDLW